MSIQVEVTDTFGGDANYGWVKRTTLPAGLTDRQVIRRAKAFAGWTGCRCDRVDYSDYVELRPRRLCQVMFISYKED